MVHIKTKRTDQLQRTISSPQAFRFLVYDVGLSSFVWPMTGLSVASAILANWSNLVQFATVLFHFADNIPGDALAGTFRRILYLGLDWEDEGIPPGLLRVRWLHSFTLEI